MDAQPGGFHVGHRARRVGVEEVVGALEAHHFQPFAGCVQELRRLVVGNVFNARMPDAESAHFLDIDVGIDHHEVGELEGACSQ